MKSSMPIAEINQNDENNPNHGQMKPKSEERPHSKRVTHFKEMRASIT
jgi:hypothetical protein